jgi:phage I-like protein
MERLDLNSMLPSDGTVPEWIELIPPGLTIQGRDGRSWINDRPLEIITAFREDGRDIPLDWEHSTHLRAPQGLPAPAAAWGKELLVRAGNSIWGRFEWTGQGRASVASREYRYVSTALLYEKETRRIRKISSVGLTNTPNLEVPALNHIQEGGGNVKATMRRELAIAINGFNEMSSAQQNELVNMTTKVAKMLNLTEEDILKYGFAANGQEMSLGLNADELKICHLLQISPEDYKKAKGAL